MVSAENPMRVPAVIGDTRVSTSETITSLDPSTGEPLADIACCSEVDVADAISAARETLETWSPTSAAERGALSRALACPGDRPPVSRCSDRCGIQGSGQGVLRTSGSYATGGADGFFFESTLVDELGQSVLAQQEMFGSVLAVTPFEDTRDAIRIAYGLVSAVWNQDVDKAHAMTAEPRSGPVFINTYGAGGGAELPFGGFKDFGYSRQKEFESRYSYTAVKTVAAHTPPVLP